MVFYIVIANVNLTLIEKLTQPNPFDRLHLSWISDILVKLECVHEFFCVEELTYFWPGYVHGWGHGGRGT